MLVYQYVLCLLMLSLTGTAVGFELLHDYSGETFFSGWDFYGYWDNLTLGECSPLTI